MSDKSKLCYLQGIGLDYVDYHGNSQVIDQNIRDQLLIACGHHLGSQEIRQSNEQLDALPWLTVLAKVQTTVEDSANFKIRLSSPLLEHACQWQLFNSQKQLILSGESPAESLAETGHYFYQGLRYSERLITLENISPEYYQLHLQIADQQFSGQLIYSPKTCFDPIEKDKLWGVSVQLYSVKSNDNFGIGDFGDLQELVRLSASVGADYILLNPLHKLFQYSPERASPYSPNDRTQLNPLYISPKLCPDFQSNGLKLKVTESIIDYPAISSAKYAIFAEMFKIFTKQQLANNTDRAKQFHAFKSQHALWQLADYDYYLQWQAFVQLNRCQTLCQQLQMKIGLMLDLAVGCAPDGEEYQRNQEIFADNVSVGAPPDPWATEGQNWGLPAINPVQLKANNYQFFITLLRANMQACGALRIDHVMGLLRLWWCVQFQGQQHGCYVYYPFENLLAILALESHKNNCLIVGEDLGVVPPEVISNMAKRHVYGNNIFYFEKNAHGEFKQPQNFRQQAMLMIANHDVPPFYAWWQADDIKLKTQYQLFESSEQAHQALATREQDQQLLIKWLGSKAITDSRETIYHAVVKKLAASASTLLCLQVEDLEGNNIPVNIPGTNTEYPNWSRRLAQPLRQTFDQTSLFAVINQGRKNATEQSSNHSSTT